MQNIPIKIKKYYYDTSTIEVLREYNKLCDDLRKKGINKSSTIDIQWKNEFYDDIPEEAEIEGDYLFNDQFSTVCGKRIWFWNEVIFPNRNIKKGYYICEGVEDIRQAQKEQYLCGYCGTRYQKPENTLCVKCLSSDSLREENFSLLKLIPVFKDTHRYERPPLTSGELDTIHNSVIACRIHGKDMDTVLNSQMERNKELDKDQEVINTQREAYIFLSERNVRMDDIYFCKISKIFTFGWHHPMYPRLKEEFEKYLIGFPYEYKINMEKD